MTSPQPPPRRRPWRPDSCASSRDSSKRRENAHRNLSPPLALSDNDVVYEDWKTLPDFMVRLDGLPSGTTLANIWDWLSPEGDIAYMDIFRDRKSGKGMTAKVRFEPPPHRTFWKGGKYLVVHPHSGHEFIIDVNPVQPAQECWIQSPVSAERQHPVKINISLKTLQFGSLLDPDSMTILKSLSAPDGDDSLQLQVNLKSKRLTVLFPMAVAPLLGKQRRQYKIVIEFATMKEVCQLIRKDEDMSLVVPLKCVPQYYWKRQHVQSTFADDAKYWSSNEAWYRVTDILEDIRRPMKHPVALHTEYDDPGFIDIGRWTTLRFVLRGPFHGGASVNQQLTSALGDFSIASRVCSNFSISYGDKPEIWSLLDHPRLSDKNALHLLEFSTAPITRLPFEVRYRLEVCISRGLLNEHTITSEFLNELSSMNEMKAKLLLEYLDDHNEVVQDPMSIFQNPDAASHFPKLRIPHYCALMHKAVITPTTIHFSTPSVEMSNRVLRRYSHIHDRFLRVQFSEEHENGRIRVSKDQNDEIYKRLLRALYEGIRIGDRVYLFLAFGNSQLRQNGAYFFCPTDHISCDDIRKWMGQFSHIKIVAKYAARLGQCLSTTREIRGISVPKIRPIPDIERNGFCFTDGVGKISQFIAQMIIEDMGLDVLGYPSAFQFRMGGCKGVLALWPDAKGTEVHVRESQEKFKSEFNGLEIIRCARFATATLNRQTIIILESLGVPISSFVSLLDRQLQSYEIAMHDNNFAASLLRRFVDENQSTLAIADLLEAGFKTGEAPEPFVLNVLNLWRSWSLKILKEKARIQVENSAFVLGCVDETQTLRGHLSATEGSREMDLSKLPQIFLQITDTKGYSRTRVITGPCIVGRNPSLHPGDIRMVEAVDEPKLHHLKDVVVFPATGDRPVPNMLSGGDLDGDDFFVIWEPTLLPPIWNYPPMNYDGSKPQQMARDVNVDDLRNFFVRYMKNDTLALIAHSHMGMADKHGPMSSVCLDLAQLHSKAVDYSKTGEPAKLKRENEPREWPHFMEKKGRSYPSRKALGVVYDKVVKKSIQFCPIWDSPFDSRILNHEKIKPNSALLNAAKDIKAQYDTCVRRLLSQFELETEFELWTGFPMSKPTIGSDYKLQEDLGREYDAVKLRFREACYEAAGGKKNEMIDRFVAAMYVVTAEETRIALRAASPEEIGDTDHDMQAEESESNGMPLISFPWIFHWVLIRLVGGSDMSQSSTPAATRLMEAQHPEPAAHEQLEITSNAGAAGTVRTDLDANLHTHLPDGTIIRQGQPLALFDEPQADTCASLTSDTDEGKESTGQSEENGSSDYDCHDVEANISDKRTDCKTEAQEESAMDRLACLVSCGEEYQSNHRGSTIG